MGDLYSIYASHVSYDGANVDYRGARADTGEMEVAFEDWTLANT